MASVCILSPHVAPDLPANVVVLCTGEGGFFLVHGREMHVEKGICTWQSGLWSQDMGLDGFVWLFLLGAPDLFLCVGSMALEKEAPIICTNVPYDLAFITLQNTKGKCTK